jgi:hypothetical protein
MDAGDVRELLGGEDAIEVAANLDRLVAERGPPRLDPLGPPSLRGIQVAGRDRFDCAGESRRARMPARSGAPQRETRNPLGEDQVVQGASGERVRRDRQAKAVAQPVHGAQLHCARILAHRPFGSGWAGTGA